MSENGGHDWWNEKQYWVDDELKQYQDSCVNIQNLII